MNVDATSSHAAELRDRTINCSDRILKSRTWAIYPGCQDEVWLLGGGGRLCSNANQVTGAQTAFGIQVLDTTSELTSPVRRKSKSSV